MRRSRLFAVVGAILILGGVAWRVTRVSGAGPSHDASTGSTPETRSEAESRTNGGTAVIRPKAVAESEPDAESTAVTDAGRSQNPSTRIVAILVVNGSGVPQAEVPVVSFGDGAPTGLGKTTGRDGIARMTWPPRSPGTSAAGGKWRAQAAIALPLDPPVLESFDLDKIPERPIRLVLPPTGSVRVALVKRDGAPFEEPATVSVALESSMYDAGRLPEAFMTLEGTTVAGTARFDRVGLGGKLTVSAVPNDPALLTVSATVGAPKSDGEEIAVTLVCGGPAVIVTGRLVTPERRAFARAHLRADVSEGAEDPYEPGLRTHASTDDAGRFNLRFDTDAHGLVAQQVRLETASGYEVGLDRMIELPPLSVTVPLPATVREGKADLGEIVVPHRELIAAGRVVNEQGGPLQGAFIRALIEERGRWREAGDMNDGDATTDAAGRFEIRGPVARGKLGLLPSLPQWISRGPTPIERGAREVELVLTRAGGLAGSIAGLGEHRRPWSRAAVEVVVAGPGIRLVNRPFSLSHGEGLELQVHQGGFTTWDLLPGTYSVRFLAGGAPEPLLVVEDVTVVAGELNRDPRLQNVDLGRFLSARVVTVLDEHDAPIREARIGARPTSDAAGTFVSFETGHDGRAAVVMPAGPVEVVVASWGHRSVVLPAVTEDVTVRLRKATPRPVTVRLADGVVSPRAPFRLEVELRMLASPGQTRPKDRNADDPRNSLVNETAPLARSAVLSVAEPGLYEVQLWLHDAGLSASMTVPLAQAGGIATVVVSEQGEASVTVAPDPEDLKAAIARRKGE